MAFQSFKLCSSQGADLGLCISKCVGGLQIVSKLPVSQESVLFSVLLTLWREKKKFYCRINSLIKKKILYWGGLTLSCSYRSELCDFWWKGIKRRVYEQHGDTQTLSWRGREDAISILFSESNRLPFQRLNKERICKTYSTGAESGVQVWVFSSLRMCDHRHTQSWVKPCIISLVLSIFPTQLLSVTGSRLKITPALMTLSSTSELSFQLLIG